LSPSFSQSRRIVVHYLQPRSFGQVDPGPVAVTLLAPSHFGKGVTKLLRHVAFFDLGLGQVEWNEQRPIWSGSGLDGIVLPEAIRSKDKTLAAGFGSN
jgi:hypothetical protein